MVVNFIRGAKLSKENAAYYFAVAVPGGFAGKPVAYVEKQLSEKGVHLDYGNKIRLNANFILWYGSSILHYKTAMSAYGRRIQAIIRDITSKATNEIEAYNDRTAKSYLSSINNVHETDKGYHADDNCTSCGICVSVCPVKNITLEGGTPSFRHQCESCMACIQFCPQKALNYKDKTQKRKRYTHPEIKHTDISRYYKN